MFSKLVVCVISMGVLGCSLLAMRQARLQAAHELAQTQLRIRSCDERLYKLRSQIGAAVRPEDVRSLVDEMALLKPMTPPPAEALRTSHIDPAGAAPAHTDASGKQVPGKPVVAKPGVGKPGAPAKDAKPAKGRPPVEKKPAEDTARAPEEDEEGHLAIETQGEEDQ